MEDVQNLLTSYLEETGRHNYYDTKPSDYETGQAILNLPPEAQISTILCVVAGPLQIRYAKDWNARRRFNAVCGQLLTRNLPYTEHDLEQLLPAVEREVVEGYSYDLARAILRQVARCRQGQGLTPAMRASLEACLKIISNRPEAAHPYLWKVKEAIDELLGICHAVEPDSGEAWADAARSELAAMEPQERQAWSTLIKHTQAADGSKPSAKWLAQAEKNRQAVGEEKFRRYVGRWMNLAAPPAPLEAVAPKYPDPDEMRANRRLYDDYQQASRDYYAAVREYLSRISEKNITIFKGLTWYCSPLADTELVQALAHLTDAAYSHVRERGAWAKSAGNAAIWALGQIPGAVGVGPLARLRTRLRDRSALKLIAAAIENAAQSAGMSVDELEDLAVPTGGLDADGTRWVTFGDTENSSGKVPLVAG